MISSSVVVVCQWVSVKFWALMSRPRNVWARPSSPWHLAQFSANSPRASTLSFGYPACCTARVLVEAQPETSHATPDMAVSRQAIEILLYILVLFVVELVPFYIPSPATVQARFCTSVPGHCLWAAGLRFT